MSSDSAIFFAEGVLRSTTRLFLLVPVSEIKWMSEHWTNMGWLNWMNVCRSNWIKRRGINWIDIRDQIKNIYIFKLNEYGRIELNKYQIEWLLLDYIN